MSDVPAPEQTAPAPSPEPPRKAVALGLALAGSLGVDLATKGWIAAALPVDTPPLPVIDGFFYLSHVRNAGTAFGFFEDSPLELRRVGFSLLAAVAGWVVVLFYRGLAPRDRLNGLALGLIVGGGLGNLIDRLGRGEVIDFLRFELWGPWSFPDFNFADVFILCGVSILMIELLVSEGAARAEVIEAGHASFEPHSQEKAGHASFEPRSQEKAGHASFEPHSQEKAGHASFEPHSQEDGEDSDTPATE